MYIEDQFNKLKPFTLNDLRYGVHIKVKSQNGETFWMNLTNDCVVELIAFFKEHDKATKNNPDI